jgi:hypothetical protein
MRPMGSRAASNNVPTYNILDNVGIAGYFFGLRVGELTTSTHMSFGPCHCAIQIPEMAHISQFSYVVVGNCPNIIDVVGGPSEVYMTISIEHDTARRLRARAGWSPSAMTSSMPAIICTARSSCICTTSRSRWRSPARTMPIFARCAGRRPQLLPDLLNLRHPGRRQFRAGCLPDQAGQGAVELAGRQRDQHNGLVAVWSGSNASGPGTASDYRIGQLSMSCDGALNKGAIGLDTANGDGTVTPSSRSTAPATSVRRSSAGICPGGGEQRSDGHHPFLRADHRHQDAGRAFASVPLVVATPDFDVGSGVRYWVSATTTTITITCSAAVTGNFVYFTGGNPN